MMYLLYLVLDYKYREYKVFHYTENLTRTNTELLEKIQDYQETLEYKSTKAYKNKILKAQQGLKNPGEIVINLITEERFKKYTQTWSLSISRVELPQNLLDEESLINTMTIYQKWIYLLFNRDTR